MSDIYRSYDELAARHQQGRDYDIQCQDRGGLILILAPHGGAIERGTSELARAIAGDHFSYYLFESRLKVGESKALHITSANFDEPVCLDLIGKFQTALAIHGCERKKPVIYVGGRDEQLKLRIIQALDANGYPVRPGSGSLAGTYPTNICNRTSARQGVQLELSGPMRQQLFFDWRRRSGRRTTTPQFDRLVKTIRGVIL